jgi:hypothetical protein
MVGSAQRKDRDPAFYVVAQEDQEQIPDRYVQFVGMGGEALSVNPYSVVAVRALAEDTCTLLTDGGHALDVSVGRDAAVALLIGEPADPGKEKPGKPEKIRE